MPKKILIILSFLIATFLIIWFLYLRPKPKMLNLAGQAAIPITDTSQLWYKNAVFYTLDIETFKDSDGDGTGDIKGLIQRLGFIDTLGVDVIWLQPFQPTPNNDDGYDVSDYYAIDKRLGTIDDFKAFKEKADSLGIKVIMDLVVNHTSIEHPWYQQARKDSASKYRSWYVWSKEKPDNFDVGMVFPGVQKETWTYDSLAGEYYFHRFYNFQPDLNTQNNQVETEIKSIIKYWIDLGLDGFRLDAVPFVVEVAETKGEKFEHQFDMLIRLRAYLEELNKNAIILGEANVLPEETVPYFGENADGIQMMFNFFVNQRLFYALASGEAGALKKALEETQRIPAASQWGQFLRNHDEVDLGRLDEKDRELVYEKFGPDSSMQLYDRGIRRRLPAMVNNNRKLLELANSVMFSLPSSPVVRYGDEIGMGDNLALKERESVRTPMQWNTDRNAGFTTYRKAVKPVIDTGVFSYKNINVKAESTDSSSLLVWTRKMILLRKLCPEIGFGTCEILETDNDHVLAIRYAWQGRRLLILNNFSDKPQQIRIKRNNIGGSRLESIFPTKKTIPLDDPDVELDLAPYGYRWFRS